MIARKKLIEVALPLDAINETSARAVIFAHMVDDPLFTYPTLQGRQSRC